MTMPWKRVRARMKHQIGTQSPIKAFRPAKAGHIKVGWGLSPIGAGELPDPPTAEKGNMSYNIKTSLMVLNAVSLGLNLDGVLSRRTPGLGVLVMALNLIAVFLLWSGLWYEHTMHVRKK